MELNITISHAASVFGALRRSVFSDCMLSLVSCRRLHWLGHIARMNDNCLPKQLLFGWLPQCRPPHGAKLRWLGAILNFSY